MPRREGAAAAPALRRTRLKLALIALLFATPFAGAWLIVAVFPQWQPTGRLNHGTLIEPARPLPPLQLQDPEGAAVPEAALRGKWSLVQLGGARCAAACRERLVLTRQVRLALDKNRRRVQRVYLAPDRAAAAEAAATLVPEHRDLVPLAEGAAPGARAADFFRPEAEDDLFLVDPAGHWLMRYHGALDHRALYQDLKKLLRFSQIG